MYIMIIITLVIAFYIYKFKKKEFLEYVKEKNEELEEQFGDKKND
jgi:uncharacterized membrane-anchored protein YitT (DUF2179 family)